MIKTLKNNRGLTLIELIAVLVILGIIAAIAVPTIGNTINAQRERAAEAEWSAIMSSAELYLAQNGDAAFSMDDLFNNDYISENVVLEEDDQGTVIASSTDIFEDDGGSVAIAAAVTEVYIDGFLVYTAP